MAGRSRAADAALYVGDLNAYCWPGLVLLAVLAMPRRKAREAAPGAATG